MPRFSKLPELPKFKFPKPKPRRLQATARRAAAAPPVDDYDDDDEVPTTRFSTAFVVVLFLHLVAVGGIYAFKSIKAHRASQEASVASTASSASAKSAAQKPAVSQEPEPAPAVVPVSAPAAAPVNAAVQQSVSVAPVSGAKVYHVRAGDTLSRVAASHAVSTADLAEANGIKESASLRQGQVLNIPASRPAAKPAPAVDAHKAEFLAKKEEAPAKTSPAAATSAPKTYTVKKGDNPVVIARNLNVSYDDLLKLNKIEDPKKLQIGAVLKVPPAKKSN